MKTVFITGTSSGFGQETAIKFALKGWNVIATMRNPEDDKILREYENILVLKLDVTDEMMIKESVNMAINKYSNIDVLINNAGYGVAGFLEEASNEEIMTQFNTNVIGAINLIKEIVPYMRKNKSGKIINVSSLGGNIAMPMFSLYSSTKFAIEGLSQSLAYELKEFEIDVKTIAPGAFKTGFSKATKILSGNKKEELNTYRKAYEEHLNKIMTTPPKPFKFGNPSYVADEIFRCATSHSNITNLVGQDAKLLMFLKKVLPSFMFRNMLKKTTMPIYKNS
ncbi:SDR family oxidoreductase [Arcobacter sp. YIC-464]|uniref:SDR family oxidoreductase n=1 Tax=Arcobacter sp. YIC-464 TaxID=3376631 RepID=UPI003C1ACA59